MTEKALPKLEEECFFIAPIGGDGTPTRQRSDTVLEYIVAKAASELGLQAVRADKIGEPGQITLQIIEHILKAKAAVADLTELNPNVFYELAVRHTAKLPVALIADKDTHLPFDIGTMRVIKFDHRDLKSADNCRKDIVAHLSQGFSGSVDSPISTTLDVFSMQSGSAVERSVAELVTSVEGLARTQSAMMREISHHLYVPGRRFTPLLLSEASERLGRLRKEAETMPPETLAGELVQVEEMLRAQEKAIRRGAMGRWLVGDSEAGATEKESVEIRKPAQE
jgi:hypothetical protein